MGAEQEVLQVDLCNMTTDCTQRLNLELVASQRIQQQVDSLALGLVLDHSLKAQGATVTNVVLLEAWESLQEELLLLCCSHSHKHLHQPCAFRSDVT